MSIIEHSEDDKSPTPFFVEGMVERTSLAVSVMALVALPILVLAEVALRAGLSYSLDASHQLGGYIIVALGFFSLSICEARGAFHRVELVQQRLTPRQRLLSRIAFDLVILVGWIVVTWELAKHTIASWQQEATSIEALFGIGLTPLWIPQLAMPLGAALLAITLVRVNLARLRALRSMPTAGKP